MESVDSYIMLSYMHCNSTPNIIRILKSRQLSGAGYVTHMELSRNAYRVLEEELRKRDL